MLFAHRQWRAGMLLADAIYAGWVPVDDQWILELGAGTGLPALAVALTRHPRKVVVTDYDDAAIVQALRTNAADCAAANPQRKMAPLTVAGHTWGHRIDDVLDLLPCTPTEPSPHFDVLLLADCVWERFSHDILLKSITHLLARTPEARIYMVAGLHTGRSTLVQFFRRALEAGLQLVPLPHLDQWPMLSTDESESDPALRGSEHVLELEVGGDWDDTGASQREPCLTGARRHGPQVHELQPLFREVGNAWSRRLAAAGIRLDVGTHIQWHLCERWLRLRSVILTYIGFADHAI